MPIYHRVWDGDDEDDADGDDTTTVDDDEDDTEDLDGPEDAMQDDPTDADGEPRTVFVVLDGDAPAEDDLEDIQWAHLVVAADGAGGWLAKSGLAPDAIVGDMDAIDPDVLEELEKDGVEVVRYPAEKDETDGRLALERALEEAPQRLVIVGAHGGRTAMFLANLGLLRQAWGEVREVEMRGHGERLTFVGRDRPFEADLPDGTPFSLIAWGDDAEVSIEGAAYEVDPALLAVDDGRGVSNQTTGGTLRITVHEGVVLLVFEDPDGV